MSKHVLRFAFILALLPFLTGWPAELAFASRPAGLAFASRPEELAQTDSCNQPPGSSVSTHPCQDILPAPPLVPQDIHPLDLTYRLAVYYVLPADIPYDQAVYDRIKDASYEIQAWYQVACGGITWEFAFPEVVQVYYGKNDRQYYVDQGNWWGSVLGEMSEAGYLIWKAGTVTALWAQGAGWWAGAAQGCGIDCGIALLGVELFPEFNNPAWSGGLCPDPDGEGGEAWPCTPVGAYAHELGHTVGLPHPYDDPATQPYAFHSIMQTHWNYPDQAPPEDRPWGFLRNERQSLRSNPFMKLNLPLIQRFEDAEIAVNLPPIGTAPATSYDLAVDHHTVRFTNTTLDADLFYWTFGDRQASNEFSLAHFYHSSGEYTATLRASNSDAMMGVMTKTIRIARDITYLPLVPLP